MIASRKSRRGVATIMALVALALVGVTIAGLITRIGNEARRTRQESTRAQHDQIVIAKSLGATTLPPELRYTAHF